MKLAHFVLTRFCLRQERLFEHLDGPWFGAGNPLAPASVRSRLKLLEAICLPGILSQTNQNFTWVLIVDRNLNAAAKQRLATLIAAKDRVHLYEYPPAGEAPPPPLEGLGWLLSLPSQQAKIAAGEGQPDYVITTLNDDDDAMPRRFVATLQDHAFELASRQALPPFKILGTKHAVEWDMAFSRAAPLGWAKPSQHPIDLASCGFSLLCRQPAGDFSILGLRHRDAGNYFDFAQPARTRNVRIYRKCFLQAARVDGAQRMPSGSQALFEAGPIAGPALCSNHGANLQAQRLRRRNRSRVRVLGAETFPHAAIDWNAVRRNARHFSRLHIAARLLAQLLRGHKGRNLLALRRTRRWLQRSPEP